jgi:hypothetical protein
MSRSQSCSGNPLKLSSLLLLWSLSCCGCSICGQPYLDDYVTYGTRTPRPDGTHGRIGSPFSDPSMDSGMSDAADTTAYYEESVEPPVVMEDSAVINPIDGS